MEAPATTTTPPAPTAASARPARRRLYTLEQPLTDKDIRKWGLVMLIGFGLIGGLFYWRAFPTVATVLWSLGGAFAAIAWIAPGPARHVHRAWMGFAHILGRINTTILLSVFYWIMFGAVALFFKAIGRDALKLRLDRQARTYWEPKRMRSEPRSYFDPF